MSAPLTFLGGAVIAYLAVRTAAAALVPAALAPIVVPPPPTPILATDGAASLDAGAYPPAYPAPAYAGFPPGYGTPAGYGPPPGYAQTTGYAPAGFSRGTASPPTIIYVSNPVERRSERFAPASYYPVPGYPPQQVSPDAPPPEYDGREYAALTPNLRTRASPGTRFDDAPGVPTSSPAASALRGGVDRWSVSSWALVRTPDPLQQAGLTTAPRSLASNGVLGASQAGMRVTYRFSRALGTYVRFSAPVDQKKLAGEGALGVSWQPLARVPVRLLAERRQRLGQGGGRSDFALLAEGGLYGQPMPFGTTLNGYAQGGVVGIKTRDLFADGGFAVTRPLLRRFAFGGGVWGGIQPGLSRLDVGPRVSMRLFPHVTAHVDYRWRMLGKASPPSGPALTLAGDF